MQLVTFKNKDQVVRLGAIVNGMVIDIAALGHAANIVLPDNILDFIDANPASVRVTNDLLQKYQECWPVGVATALSNVKLLAPIPKPRKNIFGIGLNYVEHVAESARTLDTSQDLPTQPVVFSKPPTSVIGPGDAIEHNSAITKQLDWEVELAVIIGSTAKRVRKEDAMQYVFGYSVMIDMSARDCRRAGQWIFSKGQDTYAPFGPCIITADDIPDPHNLRLWLKVNGVVKQDSNTKFMLFNVPHLISDISSAITLEAGDIIATGTPAGVGAGRNPQEWVWPGDIIEAEVEGIGYLRHPVVAV